MTQSQDFRDRAKAGGRRGKAKARQAEKTAARRPRAETAALKTILWNLHVNTNYTHLKRTPCVVVSRCFVGVLKLGISVATTPSINSVHYANLFYEHTQTSFCLLSNDKFSTSSATCPCLRLPSAWLCRVCRKSHLTFVDISSLSLLHSTSSFLQC